MSRKWSIVFYFDNHRQYKKFLIAYASIRISDKDVVIKVITNSFELENELKNLLETKGDVNTKVFNSNLVKNTNYFSKAPTLAWLVSPFYFDDEFLFIMDNDFLVSGNITNHVNSLIENEVNDTAIFFSKKRPWKKNTTGLRFLRKELNINNSNENNMEIIGCSTSSLLVNVANFRKFFNNQVDLLIDEIEKYIERWDKQSFFQKITTLHFAPDEEFVYLTFINKNRNTFLHLKNLNILKPRFNFKDFCNITQGTFIWHLHNSVHDKKFEYWELDKFKSNPNSYSLKLLKIRLKDFKDIKEEDLDEMVRIFTNKFISISKSLDL